MKFLSEFQLSCCLTKFGVSKPSEGENLWEQGIYNIYDYHGEKKRRRRSE
jgi:hypothetical protein